MLNLSLNERNQIAKMRRTEGCKSMSTERFLSALDESECNSIESSGSRNNFNNARIKKIREDFNKLRDRFLKPKIEEIRRNLYEIENKKNLSKSKIKEIEQNLIESEESLFKLNKYYDYDDIKYEGIIDIENLFNRSTNDDYYKPIKTDSPFNGDIEHQSKRDKDKNLSPREYFNMIRPYLSDKINNHNTKSSFK